ncbi:MAG: hypothetical protein ACOC80_12615 [Petrotogales bacterium]
MKTDPGLSYLLDKYEDYSVKELREKRKNAWQYKVIKLFRRCRSCLNT